MTGKAGKNINMHFGVITFPFKTRQRTKSDLNTLGYKLSFRWLHW